MASTNAISALRTRLFQKSTFHSSLKALEMALNLTPIKRMECVDISHHMGEQTVLVLFLTNMSL